MQCPGCANQMVEEQRGGVLLDVCSVCPAVWLDAGEYQVSNPPAAPSTPPASPLLPGFMPSHAPPLLTCRRCNTGELQPGTIGKRNVLLCTKCHGLFVSFPVHSPQPTSVALEVLREFAVQVAFAIAS
jgi:hypothetical protein